jgi:hypothetical protein
MGGVGLDHRGVLVSHVVFGDACDLFQSDFMIHVVDCEEVACLVANLDPKPRADQLATAEHGLARVVAEADPERMQGDSPKDSHLPPSEEQQPQNVPPVRFRHRRITLDADASELGRKLFPTHRRSFDRQKMPKFLTLFRTPHSRES